MADAVGSLAFLGVDGSITDRPLQVFDSQVTLVIVKEVWWPTRYLSLIHAQ